MFHVTLGEKCPTDTDSYVFPTCLGLLSGLPLLSNGGIQTLKVLSGRPEMALFESFNQYQGTSKFLNLATSTPQSYTIILPELASGLSVHSAALRPNASKLETLKA